VVFRRGYSIKTRAFSADKVKKKQKFDASQHVLINIIGMTVPC
jgi:hypothetical protein